jgi:hypothetical protein
MGIAMRNNNRDYKPLIEYILSQEEKRRVAKDLAGQITGITVQQHVDIGMLIHELRASLMTTQRAAATLGLSPRAFLRLRRKYGLEPVHKEWAADRKYHLRRYLYTEGQLKRIPPLDIEKSKRRSAMARKTLRRKRRRPVFAPVIDLASRNQMTI